MAGVTVERHLEVLSGLRVTGEGRLTFGDCSFVNHECLIDTAGDVAIGRNVALANRVSLLTSSHETDDPRARAGRRVLAPIVIGDGAWLGANVTVLGGVTIGDGAVVAAGSVVRADVPAHTLWAGVPARFIRALPVDVPAATEPRGRSSANWRSSAAFVSHRPAARTTTVVAAPTSTPATGPRARNRIAPSAAATASSPQLTTVEPPRPSVAGARPSVPRSATAPSRTVKDGLAGERPGQRRQPERGDQHDEREVHRQRRRGERQLHPGSAVREQRRPVEVTEARDAVGQAEHLRRRDRGVPLGGRTATGAARGWPPPVKERQARAAPGWPDSAYANARWNQLADDRAAANTGRATLSSTATDTSTSRASSRTATAQ